jgi:hypothetical protein
VLKATKKRDDFIEFWIKDNNCTERKLVAEYHVISDCHNPSYGSGKILELSDLKELRRCYETLPRGSLSFPNDLLCADPELTFQLVGRGSIPENKRASGMSLFIWVEEGGRQRQDFGWELEDRDYLFTRDSFEYLVHPAVDRAPARAHARLLLGAERQRFRCNVLDAVRRWRGGSPGARWCACPRARALACPRGWCLKKKERFQKHKRKQKVCTRADQRKEK